MRVAHHKYELVKANKLHIIIFAETLRVRLQKPTTVWMLTPTTLLFEIRFVPVEALTVVQKGVRRNREDGTRFVLGERTSYGK